MAGAPHPAAAGDPAEQWYSKAADGGDADAMFNLGALLAEQGGRPGRAVVWTRPSTPDVVMDDRLVCLALHLISLSYTWSESVPRDGRYGVHAATRAGNRHRPRHSRIYITTDIYSQVAAASTREALGDLRSHRRHESPGNPSNAMNRED
jgi:TPR repeat protein